MVQFPSLEYNLSHPHPRGQLFLFATLIIFLLVLPALVLINLATLGSELVPTLQSRFQPDDTLLEGWWGARRLPALLRPSPPRCEPKDLGRGDVFRVSNSLFDYKIMSAWNTTEHTDISTVQEQKRFEYRGESFADCYVNNTRFDWSVVEQAQTMTVGVVCPGTNPDYPVYMSMETTMTFAWLLTRDFIGQYYGPGLDLLNLNDTILSDYRKIVFAVLEVISQDSLTIMRGAHLPVLSLSLYQYIDPATADHIDAVSDLSYLNGTAGDFPAYFPYDHSIWNLVSVVVDAVNLDLGSRTYQGNIFRNASVLPLAIWNNTAPRGIRSADWARGSQSFYYGMLPTRYQTWAQALLDGWPVQLDNLTGLHNESTMLTTYLCPTYQIKPMRSLLASVFVGSATMTLSVWGVWMFITAFLAKKIMPPVVPCSCANCMKENGVIPQRPGATSLDLDERKSQARTSEIPELKKRYSESPSTNP